MLKPITPELSIEFALKTLRACQVALAGARSSIDLGQLTAKGIRNINPYSIGYIARAALVMEISAVSKSLRIIQKLRGRHLLSVEFDGLNAAKKQGNNLADCYQYSLESIEWEQIMEIVDQQYPKLESAVKAAIVELEMKKQIGV